MLDTNILISAAFFPNRRMDRLIGYIAAEHELTLSDFITDELIKVAGYEKFNRVREMEKYLKGLSYTKFKSPKPVNIDGVSIRDDADYPILFSAIKSEVDIFLTGDKDFLECDVDKPRIMTINEFCAQYIFD
jgi:putative PIN family toxin of toxin-antitoxin system